MAEIESKALCQRNPFLLSLSPGAGLTEDGEEEPEIKAKGGSV